MWKSICYRAAFYPHFCTITIQFSISFHLSMIARCHGLLDGLYSQKRFTIYALPLSRSLLRDFGSDCRCKRFFRLIPRSCSVCYAISHTDGVLITTHLSRHQTSPGTTFAISFSSLSFLCQTKSGGLFPRFCSLMILSLLLITVQTPTTSANDRPFFLTW